MVCINLFCQKCLLLAFRSSCRAQLLRYNSKVSVWYAKAFCLKLSSASPTQHRLMTLNRPFFTKHSSVQVYPTNLLLKRKEQKLFLLYIRPISIGWPRSLKQMAPNLLLRVRSWCNSPNAKWNLQKLLLFSFVFFLWDFQVLMRLR